MSMQWKLRPSSLDEAHTVLVNFEPMPEYSPHAMFSKKRQSQILHASLRFLPFLSKCAKTLFPDITFLPLLLSRRYGGTFCTREDDATSKWTILWTKTSRLLH